MQNYEKKCAELDCEYFIVWDFSPDNECVYVCYSCLLQGESYNITQIAEKCPYKKELEMYIDSLE